MSRFAYFLLTVSLFFALLVNVEAVPAAHKKPAKHSTGGTSAADIKAYLAAHNSFRAKHGAVALKWNSTLAAAAQKEVNRCLFKHSGGIFGPYGENLAAGTGSSYGINEAVRSWTNEARDYNPRSPVPSHFTQVVWKGSKQLGCAVKECSNIFDPKYGPAKFYACEYWPQGNVIGWFPKNVQA